MSSVDNQVVTKKRIICDINFLPKITKRKINGFNGIHYDKPKSPVNEWNLSPLDVNFKKNKKNTH